MTDATAIPAEIKRRNPLINKAGLAMLERLREHRDAPRWNHAAGDRLIADDLEALARFEEQLVVAPRQKSPELPEHMVKWIKTGLAVVPAFRMRIPQEPDVCEIWPDIATMSREDIAVSPEMFVPDDADLSDLIVYRTAGTTGHSLLVPHSARAAASYQPLLQHALRLHGVTLEFSADNVGCFLVCAQARTVTYPTVLSAWNQTGFAKINLRSDDWPRQDSVHRYFSDLQPLFLTGDPISFSEMMRLGIKAAPGALVSTAVAMSPSLKEKLAAIYACRVIDWYSLTETGPIGFGCPVSNSYHILSHDIYVECLDSEGRIVNPGERGEITVTGGRNPFLPLLRYRTGDWGKLVFQRCVCGSDVPRIEELEGRAPVLFRSASMNLVNPVDISGALREFPIVQHEFVQHKDLSVEVILRLIPGTLLDERLVAARLASLFEESLNINVVIDNKLGDRTASGKTVPYHSELLLED